MAKPNLALIPAAQGSKLFSVLPSSGVGDFDFTRSGSATRINSQGLIEEVGNGVSRLNYPMIDGVVKGCPHHILEPQRTNLVTYSEDFNNSAWNKIAATITPNNTISPDGTQNSDLFVPNSSGGQLYDGLGSKAASALSYTTSLYVKPKGLNSLRIYLHGSSNANRGDATFNLSNQTVSFSNNGAFTDTSASILNVGNGWYRCILVTKSDTSTSLQLVIRYDGSTDNVSGLNLWGCQTEQGSYPTSYIPTNGASATRLAETANGSGDASTFNDSEGVLMFEGRTKDDGTNKFITLSDGSDDDRITIYFYTSINDDIRFQVRSNNINQPLTPNPIGYNIDEFNKIAIKYKQNDVSAYVNGFLVLSNNGNIDTPLNLSELAFDDGGGSGPFYGNTKQVQYYNSALTDSELEQLTSWTSFTDMAEGQLYSVE